MTVDTTTAIERLRALDPADGLGPRAIPSHREVLAVRRRRSLRRATRFGSAGAVLAICGALAIGLPGTPPRVDIVGQAAAALGGPEVLHMVTRAELNGHQASGTAESWHAPGGASRTLLRDADGTAIGEVADADGLSQSWNAKDNVLYRFSGGHPLADDAEILGQAEAGRADTTLLPDTTVRGIPVHVVRVAPTHAGEDAVPQRTYFIDEQTSLPVRIAFGDNFTDVLKAEKIPLDKVPASLLEMSPHPDARVVDYGDLKHGG